MKIGELAKRTQTQADTIRYYEREGLLQKTPRSDGNYRIYGPEHVERLGFVRHCRSLDMTLDEIRTLLQFKDEPNATCEGVNALIDEHINHVAKRIRELRLLDKQLKALREQCSDVKEAVECGILAGLSRQGSANRGRNAAAHVPGTHRSSR